jgi:hypothetical protein
MTHEHSENDEAEGGPQHDHRLPNAWEIPVADGPDDLDPVDQPDDWDDD